MIIIEEKESLIGSEEKAESYFEQIFLGAVSLCVAGGKVWF